MKQVSKYDLSKYSLEANQFDNADGGIFSIGFVGSDASGESANKKTHKGNSGGSGGGDYLDLEAGNDIYTIVITNTNTSGAAINAVVFGADLYQGNAQPNAGVTVTVAQSSHSQVRSESIHSPFWVYGIKYITLTTLQMQTQTLFMTVAESAGKTTSYPLTPLTWRTGAQQITTQVDAPDLKFLVNGSFYLTVPVIANETVTIIAQIGGRVKAANALQHPGASTIAVGGGKPLPSGLVTTPAR